jgi:large subunit ribosomal protein L6
MSRVAKAPINLPSNVEFKITGNMVQIKGPKGELSQQINNLVAINKEENQLTVSPVKPDTSSWAQAGTARSLVNNMIIGVTEGFTKELELIGVGYRAQVKGNVVNLNLGFSHPIDYQLPTVVIAETPKNTIIILKSIDKQKLGQVAAEIRSYRPPEPYKGKGVRYKNELVARKEAKKK